MNVEENSIKDVPQTLDRSIPEDFLRKLQMIYKKEFGINISILEAKSIFIDVYTLVNTLIEKI